MKVKEKELRVFYFGYDKKIDKRIDKLLKSEGYKFVGSGFNFGTKARDLEYAKQ